MGLAVRFFICISKPHTLIQLFFSSFLSPSFPSLFSSLLSPSPTFFSSLGERKREVGEEGEGE